MAVSGFRFRARLGFSIPSSFSGPRGITPAFGYGAPHPSARGTLTLLNNVLLSTQYGAVRPLQSVHVRRSALHLLGPASISSGSRHSRGLPVLVHVVSQRAQVLRLRRAGWPLASSAASRVAFPLSLRGQHPDPRFSKLDSPAHRYPCLRFKRHLEMSPARLRAKMDSLSPFL